MRSYVILVLLCLAACTLSGQLISGKVVDERGEELLAVNVYCSTDPSIGAVTNFEGDFELNISGQTCDTFLVSYLGYETKLIPLSNLQKGLNEIVLFSAAAELAGVEIKASPNVTETFSLMQMTPLDIYLNPNAAADPLKAITTLPYSTNDTETANPNLRGSSAGRSRVYLNGVPVEKPVKNAQLDGVGFFSLFNTALLEKQVVYPSNPPLNFGNASAGLVELETQTSTATNSWQLTAGLANLGFQKTNPLGEKGLVQVYGNWNLSDLFLDINKSSLPDLQSFTNRDVGVNMAIELPKDQSLRFYSYFLNEGSQVNINLFTFEGLMQNSSIRNFNILNYKKVLPKGWLTVVAGYDWRNSDFEFGNIATDEKERQLYTAVNWKHFFSESDIIQLGITSQRNSYKGDIQRPIYYFANSPESPFDNNQIQESVYSPEAYVYYKRDLWRNLTVGLGLRQSLMDDFTSFQINSKWTINDQNWVLASGGRYHNWTNLTYFRTDYTLLSSDQLSLEYTFDNGPTVIQAAGFYKFEREPAFPDRVIKGLELFWQQDFGQYFQTTVANTVLDVSYQEPDFTYQAENDYNYFFKFTLNYNNRRLFNLGISGIFRPGTRYTDIIGATPRTGVDFFEPVYSNSFNSQQLANYQSVNLAWSKTFDFNRYGLIVFANFSNVLNRQNERTVEFFDQYQRSAIDHFAGRTFYAGFVLSLSQ